MARAGKALLVRIPGNAAAKMGALAVHRKKTTIFKPGQEEFAIDKGCNAAGRELLYGSDDLHASASRQRRFLFTR